MLRQLGQLRGWCRPRRRRRWRLGLCQLNLLFHLRLRLQLRFWLRLRFWLGFRRQGFFFDLVRQDQLVLLLFFLRKLRRRSRRRRSEYGGGRRRRRRRWSRRLWLLRRWLVRATFLRDNASDRSEDLLHRRFLGRFSVVHPLVPGGAAPSVHTQLAPSIGLSLARSGATPVILATSVGFLKEWVSRRPVENPSCRFKALFDAGAGSDEFVPHFVVMPGGIVVFDIEGQVPGGQGAAGRHQAIFGYDPVGLRGD